MISLPAWSQVRDRPVLFNDTDGVVSTFVTSPTLSAKYGSASSLQWLKVELHYGVTLPADQPQFLPQVTFNVWIEGRDLFDPQGKAGEGIAVALTGTATYVNVPVGKDNYGVFYVHPNTLARYCTADGYTDFDRKFNVHAEAQVGGQLSDYYDKAKEQDSNWFKLLKVIGGLVYRQDQCAFLLDSPDRYPALVMEGGSSSAPASTPAPTPSPAPAPAPAPAQ